MIKPTVGRVVWYHPAIGAPDSDKTLAAIVCHVWSDTCVNLAVFDANGNSYSQTSVFLYQGEGGSPSSQFAEWMPYQIGQAAKAVGV